MAYTYRYPRPALTVDCCIFSGNKMYDKILLIQRKNYPFEGKWAFPGGFVDMDETIEDAALRELEEETNLSDIRLQQFKTYSDIDRDPRGRTVSIVFYGFADANKMEPKPADDACDARWFPLTDLPELAFDHKMIISEVLEYLKNKK